MGQKTAKEKSTMFLSSLLSEYRAHLLTSKVLASTTRRNYLCRLDRFLEFLPPEAAVTDLTRSTIARYLAKVGDASKAAVPMHYSAIHAFCIWLQRQGWIRSDPCIGIALPKASRKRREPVPEDIIPALLAACDRLPRTEYKRVMGKAAASLLIYGALRSSELAGMLVGDVNLSTGEVFIREGKGGKTRSIYVCKECVEAVKAFLKIRMQADHAYLLAQSQRYGMRPYAIRSLMRDLHRVAGIEESYTPHQFRHACATRLHANGAPITAIQAFLGHSRPEITFHYLHSNEEQLKSIAHLASLAPQKSTEVQTPKTAKSPTSAKQQEIQRFRVRRLR